MIEARERGIQLRIEAPSSAVPKHGGLAALESGQLARSRAALAGKDHDYGDHKPPEDADNGQRRGPK